MFTRRRFSYRRCISRARKARRSVKVRPNLLHTAHSYRVVSDRTSRRPTWLLLAAISTTSSRNGRQGRRERERGLQCIFYLASSSLFGAVRLRVWTRLKYAAVAAAAKTPKASMSSADSFDVFIRSASCRSTRRVLVGPRYFPLPHNKSCFCSCFFLAALPALSVNSYEAQLHFDHDPARSSVTIVISRRY